MHAVMSTWWSRVAKVKVNRHHCSDVSPWPWPWHLKSLALALALRPKSLALVLALRVVLGLGLDPCVLQWCCRQSYELVQRLSLPVPPARQERKSKNILTVFSRHHKRNPDHLCLHITQTVSQNRKTTDDWSLSSLERLLSHYIDTVNAVSFDCDTKLADICRRTEFQPLAYLFERILTVPASSAPVERIFSKSGLIARPHRAKMSDKLLKSLVFAKCSLKWTTQEDLT